MSSRITRLIETFPRLQTANAKNEVIKGIDWYYFRPSLLSSDSAFKLYLKVLSSHLN
jgi:hypothetical protein